MERTSKRKKKHHVPARLNVLFFAVFVLFSALILRLGVVQIVEGQEFVKELERTSNTTARIDAPRGLMYDRFGHVIVDNELELSVTYTNPSRATSSETMLSIAKDLESLIDIEIERITERDKQDYILMQMSPEERYELVSREERNELGSTTEEYRLEVERISSEEIEALTEKDLRILAIYREMSRGYANSPQRIKRGITVEEAHKLSENLYRLPGIDILRDSRRNYVYGESLRSLFGSTGSIPREKADYYLSRGYDRSDFVGTSFLELQYEEVLRGQKAVVESITHSSGGQTIENSVNERQGRRGNDLVLSVDMELQQRLESIIEEEMKKAGNSFILDRSAYAVLMDPRTGDILSMAGFNDPADRDRPTNADHIGNVTKAFEMGSSIKAASVLTGFEAGVAHPGKSFNDRPIRLPSTPEKKSVRNYGWLNDVRALEVSSNVYMFEMAMLMAGCHYPNQCNWTNQSVEQAYNEIRYHFSQFGLGADTGIDLPTSSTGLQGGSTIYGNLLDLMIGQYDTYTTLQLAQYISTIANDGLRMQPRIVTEIREPVSSVDEHGAVSQKFEPKVLNRVDMNDEYISRVQQGLRGVMTRGTASSRFANKSYQPAGKTGTAQVRVAVGTGDNRRFIDGNTQTLVGYAPFNEPEVAFAVVVPNVKLERNGGRQGMAQEIASQALDAYFELKTVRNGPEQASRPILEQPDE
ncbi:penicillin-binding protein 2 [Alkalihalobacillus sp. MEB130]|uniref:peptidoglycan D,D-transpeptidase FtsI family protein n=1 Tax=Alkalihalobacillus sp. MEB130 TaxID=2976704 RepID=UPI0028DE7239|nr:penicillin-binding protein 2 [Alkalihalobacillus sp. MEB130]MDT8861738.1 penicillin-binding protein 2 [Alkalihalobacillus sp. MEB130]